VKLTASKAFTSYAERGVTCIGVYFPYGMLAIVPLLLSARG